MTLQSNELLEPTEVFGLVEENLYRINGSITDTQAEFLQPLKIKTLLILSMETVSKPLRRFVERNNIKIIHLGLKKWQPDLDSKPVSEELIKEALEIILEKQHYPILLACS
ncbi:hypothetical protein BB560_005323 [Smittium megazygosporum]|uniref:Tyrosine-protein phosphatase domain-containing protein n=1 Tax=Smittium megazygosporum TaxID=133381 RepID=A0A2T9Z6X9_9FUNG|nr:hypothetical protein BB560_005323 [Smittium megazygosporum]